jgi:hypothetical protein
MHFLSVSYVYMLPLNACGTFGEGQQLPQQQCALWGLDWACAAAVSSCAVCDSPDVPAQNWHYSTNMF